MSELWYQDGLRFTCTQCGHCCTGAPGNVWVGDDEIADLAEHLNLTEEEMRTRHTRPGERSLSLIEKPNGDCIFYDREHGCTVYEARPKQCRTWPFWHSNLEDPSDWERTCEECPGSGQGELIPVEEIIVRARKILL